jgi:hypothetical protein
LIKKLFFAFLLLVLAGYGAAEVGAKRFAEARIEKTVAERHPQARDVDAEVSAPLIFDLARGESVRRVEVSAGHLGLGDLLADRAIAEATRVQVDLGASVRERKLVIDSIDRLDLSLEISQEELSKLAPPGFSFELGSGVVTVRGPVGSVQGRLEVASPSELRFRPQAPLPGLPAIAVTFDLAPLVDCLQGVEVVPGILRVTCSKDDPPTDVFLPGGRQGSG